MIFAFPAAGLVLFKESDGVMKIVRGFVYAAVISLVIFIVFVAAGIPWARSLISLPWRLSAIFPGPQSAEKQENRHRGEREKILPVRGPGGRRRRRPVLLGSHAGGARAAGP